MMALQRSGVLFCGRKQENKILFEAVLGMMVFALCYSINELEDLQEEHFMKLSEHDGKISELERENLELKSRMELLEGQVKTGNNDANDNTCG